MQPAAVLLPALRQKLKLGGTLKSVQFGLMAETDFRRFIRELERDPLFKQLAYPKAMAQKVICFRPFGNACHARPLGDAEVPDRGNPCMPEIQKLLGERPDIERVIRRIGQDAFCAHFLNNDGHLDQETLARESAMSPMEVVALIDWVNDFFVQCHFSEPSGLEPAGAYVKVAAFEKGVNGWVVAYFSPLMTRGRYVIDHARLAALRACGLLKVGEPALRRLLRSIECVNERKTGLDLILQWFALRHGAFLDSGRLEDLEVFSQKELARQVGRHRSTVCRALQGRSVVLPWGEEKPLRELFLTRKQKLKRLIDHDHLDWNRPAEAVRRVLYQRFGVRLSRRSVAAYRQELDLPSRRSPR